MSIATGQRGSARLKVLQLHRLLVYLEDFDEYWWDDVVENPGEHGGYYDK